MTHLSEKLGEKDCVIYMDNAPIHRAVRNFEGVHERHEIHRFDAPYSPLSNPVEGCFGIVKASVKRQLKDFNPELDPQNANFEGQTLTAYRQARLLALVPGALEELTRDKVRGFYRRVEYDHRVKVIENFKKSITLFLD